MNVYEAIQDETRSKTSFFQCNPKKLRFCVDSYGKMRIFTRAACRQTLMKREHAITKDNPVALPCLASSSKRFETDCALNRLHDWLSLIVLPKKRHVSLTPASESACLTHFQRQARPCSLAVRIQGATACASPEESNEKRRLISRWHFVYSLKRVFTR